MASSISALVERPDFSREALAQASSGGHILERHRSRPYAKTTPVDNVLPDELADRDDGISVKETRDGYIVEVTIADVAAHIRLDSPIAQAILERFVTIYGLGWRDPLVSEILEQKLSLENGQERLGLTIQMELDNNFSIRYREFIPVITRPQCLSYAQASHLINSGDKKLQLIAHVASGIRQRFFNQDRAQTLLEDTITNIAGLVSIPLDLRDSMKVVATYMLFANNVTAEFFRESGLPFLYRNFNSAAENPRALYSPEPAGHDALELNQGLRGVYSHVTSPIRRAPDYLNAHMIHYVVEQLNDIEAAIIRHYRNLERTQLHKRLWQNGPRLLQAIFGETATDPDQAKALLNDILLGLSHGLHPKTLDRSIGRVIGNLHHKKPPLTKDQLRQYADHFNAVADNPEQRATQKQWKKAALAQNIDARKILKMEDKAFSAYLAALALTDLSDRTSFDAIRERIKSGKSSKSGAVVLLDADPSFSRWHALKREFIEIIKDKPAIISDIFNSCQSRWSGKLAEQSIAIAVNDDASSTPADNTHIAFVTMMRDDGSLVAAPFYSVGSTRKMARSHARLSFLSYYALRRLVPFQQAGIPNLLYASLASDDVSRAELVRKMTVDAGGNYEEACSRNDNQDVCRLKISEGPFNPPIEITTTAGNLETARSMAHKHMLRTDGFKRAVMPPSEAALVAHPQIVLAQFASQNGITVKFSNPEEQKKGGFIARIETTRENGSCKVSFAAHGPNKRRALVKATMKAISHFKIPYSIPSNVQGWSTHGNSRAHRLPTNPGPRQPRHRKSAKKMPAIYCL